MRQIEYTKAATKGLKKLPKNIAKSFFEGFERIAADDTIGLDFIKMKNEETYRLRIGKYRAIISMDMVILTVEKVGSRGDIYK